MLQQLNECPICQSKSFSEYLVCEDFLVSHEKFHLVKCTQCQFVFTNPRPAELEIGRYYQSADYISHQNKSTSFINGLYKIVRNYTLKQKLKLVNSISEKDNILDYGCGTGHFLNICKNAGWNPYGIEPDPTARNISKQSLPDHIFEKIEETKNTQFNTITLWHVLEHVHQLNETLVKLRAKLHPNGKLLLALPNHQSKDSQLYGKFWAGYDVPRHLYHFDKGSVNQLAQKHNFNVEKILPMKFDSFYVSMLSEKYKGNRVNLITPFINGCKSNIYAKKGLNYSSLIFILSK